MNSLNNFYNSILNIKDKDSEPIIRKVVEEEITRLNEKTHDLSGFCKYISIQIQERLKELNIKTYFIDLNEIINVDHVFLITEYKYKNEIKRFLIDPTFIQFVKKDNHKLLNLSEWPSEKINDSKIVKDLLSIGLTEINDLKFNSYVNAFTRDNVKIDLDKFLLKQNLDSISIRK